MYTTAMISHFLEGWSADQVTYTTTTVTFIRSPLISTTLPSFQRQSQFRKDHASQKMLLSKSSRKFRHAVAYGYSVARHCWTNWRHGGCRWWRRCRVQRTREWQIEGYIMLVATNNPQELKSELWYFRIIGSLIMHLIKEKQQQHSYTLLRNQIYKEIELLMTSSIKQMQEYKSIQSSNDGIDPKIKMRYKSQ